MHMNKKPLALVLPWIILLSLVFIWGSSFILMKKGLIVFSSEEVAALRISITFIVLFPFFLKNIRNVTGKQWLLIAITGIIGNGIPAFLFTKAQTVIDSSLAGILNALTPLFTLIVGIIFFTRKSKWFNVAGVFIGFAGAAGLLALGEKTNLSGNISYGIYVVIATILYAFNINIIKQYLTVINSVTYTSFAFFIIGIPALVYVFTTDFIYKMETNDKAIMSLTYIIILAVIGTALATVAYNYLLKISSTLFAASVTYMMPIVAVLWGVYDGEVFKAGNIIWIILILTGVFLVNTRKLKIFNK